MISFKKHVRRFLNILWLKCISRISDFEDLPPDNSSYDDSWMDNATPGLNPDGTPDFHIVMTLHRNPMGSHFTETYGHILPPKTLLSLFPPMPEGLSPPPYHKRAKMRGALVHRPDSCLETDSSMDDKEQHGYDGGEQSIRDEDLEESSECSYQLSSLAYDSGMFF